MPKIKVGAIKQIALAVKDLERSVDFYENTLGLPLLFRAPPAMAFFDCHGIRLLIGEAEEVTPGGPILYFSVEDIEAAHKTLAAKGAKFIRKPQMTHKTDTYELWLAPFKDPDGHTLELFEEKAI